MFGSYTTYASLKNSKGWAGMRKISQTLGPEPLKRGFEKLLKLSSNFAKFRLGRLAGSWGVQPYVYDLPVRLVALGIQLHLKFRVKLF